jgi:hypothetical protein
VTAGIKEAVAHDEDSLELFSQREAGSIDPFDLELFQNNWK